MPRMRGNLFTGSFDEELREALAANPNFVQVPNWRGRYVSSTRAQALAPAVPDASDPPYTPTASAERAEAEAETEGIDSPAAPAASPRRSMRLRPFYVDREAEPTSGNRRTRATRELLIQLSSSESQGSEDSRRAGAGRGSAGRSTRSSSYEFADDNFPSNKAARIEKSRPESEANSAISVGAELTPRAHRRKQNRPFRGPVV